MSNELREIRQRILTTRQIRKVVTALQRVASARLTHARRAIDQSDRYLDRLSLALRMLLRNADDAGHPLMTRRAGGADCLVVFGSDRGLCGGYNRRVIEEAQAFCRAGHSMPGVLICVGRALGRRLRKAGMRIDHIVTPATLEKAGEVTSLITEGWADGRSCRVTLLYTRFVSSLKQDPIPTGLLPVDRSDICRKPDPEALPCLITLEPGPAALLNDLLPEFVARSVEHAFLHSTASENASRQMAMTRASENARRMLGSLVLLYNRVRQENITTEMLEIIGGASASAPAES